MRPLTKVHYYAFLLDAVARFPNEGLQVGIPNKIIAILRKRHGKSLRRTFLNAVIDHMSSDEDLSDRDAGLVVEFGVYKGVSISRLGNLFPDQTIYGFDSFQGFPTDGRTDWKSDFSTAMLPDVPDNVKLIEGYFEDTLPIFKDQIDSNSFLKLAHIDCDIYSSTRTIFSELDHLFKPGSVILFDELLNYRRFVENEFLAFYEFLVKRNLDFVWYAKRGKIVNFHDYCHKKLDFSFEEHRENGYYQYAAVKLVEGTNLNQRLERFEKQATELAGTRKAVQKLSPTYAGQLKKPQKSFC